MADTEDISFVVQAADIADFDSMKGPPDGRIAALRKESFVKTLFCAEYGRESQETLISIVVEKLSFHIGVGMCVDQPVVGVKEQTVFRKTSAIHGVGEGGRVAPVRVKAFGEKESRGGFQKAGIDGKSVLAQQEG